MPKFKVTIEFSGVWEDTVSADSEESAIETVLNNANFGEVLEIDGKYAEELHITPRGEWTALDEAKWMNSGKEDEVY